MRQKKYKNRLDQQLYDSLKKFQDQREAITAEAEKRISAMQRFAGSAGYEEDVKAIREKESASLEALRDEYKKRCFEIIAKMDAAIDARPIVAPSADMVNMLNLLQMRESVTVGDLETVAKFCQSCPAALEVVQERANKAGIHRNFKAYNTDITSSTARNINIAIRAGVGDFLMNDTTRASRLNAQHGQLLYGADAPLRKRPLFDSQESCYKELAGVSGDMLNSWTDVVSGAYFEGDVNV